jgi:hypothetical protein
MTTVEPAAPDVAPVWSGSVVDPVGVVPVPVAPGRTLSAEHATSAKALKPTARTTSSRFAPDISILPAIRLNRPTS